MELQKSPLCLLCGSNGETLLYSLYESNLIKLLWGDL